MTIDTAVRQETKAYGNKKLAHGKPATAKVVPGRREFFAYRDLGVTEASEGFMRAQFTTIKGGMETPTGWHYHVCDAQFVYCLNGWVDLDFEDGTSLRLNAGESLYIPPNMKHNETAIAKDADILELSVPAKMDTVACDEPAGWTNRK